MLDSYNNGKFCLNGWWDFIPLYDSDYNREDVPKSEWNHSAFLVPSIWNKPLYGVRKEGEKYYNKASEECYTDEYEFLFDAYAYPVEWSKTRNGWIKRNIKVNKKNGKRYYLSFEGIAPRAALFVNGEKAYIHNDPSLPMECDITAMISDGENEIAVLVEDYEKMPDTGKNLSPSGNEWLKSISGIWQDVYLIEKNEVFVSDVTIVTSVRKKSITLSYEVKNTTPHPVLLKLLPQILKWKKNKIPHECPSVLKFDYSTITIGENNVGRHEVTFNWDNPNKWFPNSPNLYWLMTSLVVDKKVVETSFERFGFREVWIDGHNIMLNDYPVHMFSDWGHKITPFHHTREWILKWFNMIKDCNMNHSRLHTHPHPKIYMELADEKGILLTGETALHGSGMGHAASQEEFWKRSKEHVLAYVKRDKNHPSIVLWSVENEMRWNIKSDFGNEADREKRMIKNNLTQLRKLFNEIDPTRPAYHEGDSSMWDEKGQVILSRHYGHECTGMGWWDRKKPLHSGEMCLYHYAGPNNTVQLGGEKMWEDIALVDETAATDLKYVVENARSNEVCCLGPWNLSCLVNLRMDDYIKKLSYQDYTIPGVKPLQVAAHSSEFTFWEDGKGYYPQKSFYIQRDAFRPFALIDNSQKSSYFCGGKINREVYVINDTVSNVKGTLRCTFELDGNLLFSTSEKLFIKRGYSTKVSLNIKVPKDQKEGKYNYHIVFVDESGRTLDNQNRKIKIESQHHIKLEHKIAVFGPGYLKEAFDINKLDYKYINCLDDILVDEYGILVMEKNTVEAGSRQNLMLKEYICNGGRLVLMEQNVSLFPDIKLTDKPVWKGFKRAKSLITENLSESDLFAWGEDQYTLPSHNSHIATKMYRKDDGSSMKVLIDSGEGAFGYGDLDYAMLFEVQEGKGLIIACQMRLTEKMEDTPPAWNIFINMLDRADKFQSSLKSSYEIHNISDMSDTKKIIEEANSGKTVILNTPDEKLLKLLNDEFDMDLSFVEEEHGTWQAVISNNEDVLQGLSNEDVCGIEEFTYAGQDVQNYKIADKVIKMTDKLVPLLITPDKSLLKELLVLKGGTEPLRAHTFSRFYYGGEKPVSNIVAGKIQTGKGCIIINMFNPPLNKRIRFNRFINKIQSNLGKQNEKSLLEGVCVTERSDNSQGYPDKIYILNDSVGEKKHEMMVGCTEFSVERMNTTPILDMGRWVCAENKKAEYKAKRMDIRKDIYIYYTITSPIVRKNMGSNLGVPDPNALTNLELSGEGDITLYINKKLIYNTNVEDGTVVISDIELEKGFNHVLMKWKPVSEESELKLYWRNIMRQPERTFVFMDSTFQLN